MIRNLKVLGIAMAAVFAFSAMSAASASAQTMGHITGPEKFTLLGEEVGEPGANAFTAFGQEPVECPETIYTGHRQGITPHTEIVNGDTAITVTPHYEGCVSGEAEREVDMNGCDYTFYDFTTTPAENNNGTYGFTIDLQCNETSGVLVKGGACTVTVPSQTELTGLHATNLESGQITIAGTVHSITASACGGLLHTSEAQLHQDIVVFDTGLKGVSISD